MKTNHYHKLILAGTIILAALLRLFYLDSIPTGFIPEEVSNGWNAYSLLKTGRDEWGVVWPVIFRETGGFKLALNSYLIIPVIALLGANELAVRLPAALAGVAAVYLTYLLVKLLYRKYNLALIAALLLAISPWHISVGRYGVDVNLGVPLFLLGLVFFLKAKTNIKWLILAGWCFALTYYTYFNYVVFTILFLSSLIWVKRKWLWLKNNRKFLLIFLIIQVLSLWPYISQPNLLIRFRQATSVSQIGFINRINENRQACSRVYPSFVCRGVYNKFTDRLTELVRNIIGHYSTTTLFLYGSELGLAGMPRRTGFFYPFEFLLLVLGIAVMLRQRLFNRLMVFWLFLYGVPSSLAAEGHIWRMLTLLPLPQIIASFGLLKIIKLSGYIWIKIGTIVVMVYFITRFLIDYTGYFPYAQGAYSYYGFRDLYKYLATVEKDYPRIMVAPVGLGFDQLYIYYLFYLRPDPANFQQGTQVDRVIGSQGWVQVKRIGKWYFREDLGDEIVSLPDKTLLVTDGNFSEKQPLPKKILFPRLIHTIYHANGNPAFKILELTKKPPV